MKTLCRAAFPASWWFLIKSPALLLFSALPSAVGHISLFAVCLSSGNVNAVRAELSSSLTVLEYSVCLISICGIKG